MVISTHFQVRQNVLRREVKKVIINPCPLVRNRHTSAFPIPNVCRVEALHVNSLPLKQNPWKIKFPFGISSRAASFLGSVWYIFLDLP